MLLRWFCGLLFLLFLSPSYAEPSDSDDVFKKLDKQTQDIKLRILDLNKEAAQYLQKSDSELADRYKGGHRGDFSYDFVLRDYRSKDYLAAINRYHIGRSLDVISSKYEKALTVARIYLDYGLYDYSARIFTSLLGNEDSAVASLARYNLARQNYIKHYWDEALKGFESVVDGIPQELLNEKWIMQGIILQSQVRHQDAIKAFNQVPDGSKEYVYAQFNIAMSNLRQGWWSDAEEIIDRLLERFNNREEPIKDEERELMDRLYVAMGYAQLQRRYYREAHDSLSKVSGQGAFTYKAKLGLGLVAAEQGSYKEALEIMRGLVGTYSKSVVTEEANVVIPFLLESVASLESTIGYYSEAVDYFTGAVKEVDAALVNLEQGKYDQEFLARAQPDMPGFVNAQQRPQRGELNRYLFELLQDGRWQEESRSYFDVLELDRLLDRWRDELTKAGVYDKKTYKKLVANIDKSKTVLAELGKQHKDFLRAMVKDRLETRRGYFASYLSQSMFALARNYDTALGSKTTSEVGDAQLTPEMVRTAYRDYLNSAEKTSVNRRSALVRLAELETDRYDEILAQEYVGEKNKALAMASLDASIKLMNQAVEDYPEEENNDEVLYRLIDAYEKREDKDNARIAMRNLVDRYPQSRFYTQVQFKLGEEYLTTDKSIDAELAYSAALRKGNDGSVYFRRALYNRGWSRLKQSLYEDALEDFFEVLKLSNYADNRQLNRAEQELYDDVLRAVSLCFSNLGGVEQLNEYFQRNTDSQFKNIVYNKMSELYVSQQRFNDAGEVHEAFVKTFPLDAHAPEHLLKLIDVWAMAGYREREFDARLRFDQMFALDGAFWKKHEINKFTNIRNAIKINMQYMTSYYHNAYQKNKQPEQLSNAKHWYERYFNYFPDDPESGKTHFLYAELLSDAGELNLALQHYDKASGAQSGNVQGAEAAYAKLLTMDNLAKQDQSKQDDPQWFENKVEFTVQFVKTYPRDPRAPDALIYILEGLYNRKQYQQVVELSELYPQKADKTKADQTRVLKAHALFALERYAEAETLYDQLLRELPPGQSKQYGLSDRLASAIYKQGEAADKAGDQIKALHNYLRVWAKAPQSEIAASAEFDAANLLIKQQNWDKAAEVLERFKVNYPSSHLQAQVTEKLAFVYRENAQSGKSASAFEQVANNTNNDEQTRRGALWDAAELYETAGNLDKAIELYTRYVREYPDSFSVGIEARQKLVTFYGQRQDVNKQNYWRREIIEADAKVGRYGTERSRYLAATASLSLAQAQLQYFDSIELKAPLKQNLARKKSAMQMVIEGLTKASAYGVQETTTEATFHIAEVYRSFGKSLLNSERPSGLSEAELGQYEVLLEEQAYPFEEKAIEFHKLNVQRVKSGVYDHWVDDSFKKLAILEPARFGKKEKLEPFIEVPTRYVTTVKHTAQSGN